MRPFLINLRKKPSGKIISAQVRNPAKAFKGKAEALSGTSFASEVLSKVIGVALGVTDVLH